MLLPLASLVPRKARQQQNASSLFMATGWTLKQGCQVADFQTKNPNSGKSSNGR
jgi:hypothetical protein